VISRVNRESSDWRRPTSMFVVLILSIASVVMGLLGSGSVRYDYDYSLLVGSPKLNVAATSVEESSFAKNALEQTSSEGSPVLTDGNPVEKYASVKNALKKTAGEGWEMWNRQTVMSYTNYTCRWTTFNATNGETSPMCVHPVPDVVSRNIKNRGRFPDCDQLTKLWQKDENAITDQSVYLEIGGNIGACVMQMLLTTTNVPIIVFEPDPRNRFCMTSSLMALSQDQRERVSLFPIALGSEAGSSTINSAKGNFGNSVVGMTIPDHGVEDQEFLKPIPIRIERIDSILDTDNAGWNVPLMKMDSQGFECRIMDGGGAVLERIGTIATEMANRWLTAQGCSDAGLVERMRAADFDVFFRGSLLQGKPPPGQGNFDILNVKRKKGRYLR
jgi:FkbM family methyltransferase